MNEDFFLQIATWLIDVFIFKPSLLFLFIFLKICDSCELLFENQKIWVWKLPSLFSVLWLQEQIWGRNKSNVLIVYINNQWFLRLCQISSSFSVIRLIVLILLPLTGSHPLIISLTLSSSSCHFSLLREYYATKWHNESSSTIFSNLIWRVCSKQHSIKTFPEKKRVIQDAWLAERCKETVERQSLLGNTVVSLLYKVH